MQADVITRVVAAVEVPCQVAGGIRDADRVAEALAAGASRVVLGSALIGKPLLAKTLAERYGPDRIVAAIDVRDGQALTEEAPFVAFTAEQSGAHQVLVRATSNGQGGLFVVESEREPQRLQVTGYVGDDEDDPVPGITLRFLREPSSDVIGEATSDDSEHRQGDHRQE